MIYSQLLPLGAADPLEHVLPHPVFGTHLTWFSNHSLMVLLVAVFMLLVFPRLFPKPDSSAPTGARNFFESILEFLRVEVFRPALKEHTDKFVPFLWTLFFFILFCNLLGALPIPEFFELISFGHLQHLGGTATGGLATTGALAICAFFFIHAQGIDIIATSLMDGTYGQHGHHDEHTSDGTHGHEAAQDLQHVRGEALAADVPANFNALANPSKHYHDDEHPVAHQGRPSSDEDFETQASEYYESQRKMTPVRAIVSAIPLYLWNFAPHPFKPKPGGSQIGWFADVPMWFGLLLLELLGACIKPFALCMRLFANMIAGHIMLAVLISLVVAIHGAMQFAVGGPVAVLDIGIQILELFVAFLQAYIFTFLTTLFIASAVAPEH